MINYFQFDSAEIRGKTGPSYNPFPSIQDAMHCIIFVIRANTHMNDWNNAALRKIKTIQGKYNGPRNVFKSLCCFCL